MTQLERSMSKAAFAVLERIRRARGIRSRAKALKIALLELAPDEYEIDGVIVQSPEDDAIFAARLKSYEEGNWISAKEVWKKIDERS